MPFFSPKGEPLQNPYTLLNLEHGTCTDDDIAKSFKKLMLQLHPDKQPPGQSPEEAEKVAQKLHDVMDAKSFLLDGEHLAARREYDAKLVKAKQPQVPQMPLPTKGGAAVAPKKNDKNSHAVKKPSQGGNSSNNNYNRSGSGGGAKKKSEAKAKAAELSKKNVNVKQWGRPASSRRQTTLPRRVSDEDGPAKKSKTGAAKNGKNNKASSSDNQHQSENKNPMKNKVHVRARTNSKAFDDSCGDCSTTDDWASTSDDEGKRRHTYASNVFNSHKPSTNRPTVHKAKSNKIPRPTRPGPERSKSVDEINKRKEGTSNNIKKSCSDFNKTSCEQQQQGGNPPKSGYKPSEAKTKADLSTFYPAIDILQKQYHCPLTKEVMKEPMSDFEGNNYERTAILKYLETHSTSPVTGNPLYSMHLTPNTALMEKIKYTLKLKTCLDSLQQQQQRGNATNEQPRYDSEVIYSSLREAVDIGFIKDLNSGSPSITIPQLDESGHSYFLYLGLKFRLEVPVASVADNLIVQTWFDHSKKAANISGRIVQFNAALQKMGLGGKLTFRNMNGKHAFTLTKKMDPEQFSKTTLRHAIEYFMEMAIKLHNIINTSDIKKVGKVRLVNREQGTGDDKFVAGASLVYEY